MVKLTKEIRKNVKNWLKENEFTVGCRLGKEFLFDCEDNFIMLQAKYDNSFDYDFMECLRNLGLKEDFDCITLSILHELGHYETMEDFTNEKWNNDAIQKEIYTFTISNQHELNVKYWECSTEKSANEWLVWFANNFQKEVNELDEIIGYAYI